MAERRSAWLSIRPKLLISRPLGQPSSVCRKIGVGNLAAIVVLPTRSAPWIRILGLCSELANIGEVHMTSSLSFLAEDEIERDVERTARLAVGIATERAANRFGVSAVLNRDRECDGSIARAGVGGRIALVVPEE